MKIKISKEKGFTLIELLVVIAILALLATIILAGMDSARSKARNSKRNSMALEYIKALELYRNDNTGYPAVGDSTIADYHCLGDWNGQRCWNNVYEEDSSLISSLSSYLPGDPINDLPIENNWYGTVYAASTTADNSDYTLMWFMEGHSSTIRCVEQARILEISSTVSRCWFNSSREY